MGLRQIRGRVAHMHGGHRGSGKGPRLDPGEEVPAARRGSCAPGNTCETGIRIWQEAGQCQGGHAMRLRNLWWNTIRRNSPDSARTP